MGHQLQRHVKTDRGLYKHRESLLRACARVALGISLTFQASYLAAAGDVRGAFEHEPEHPPRMPSSATDSGEKSATRSDEIDSLENQIKQSMTAFTKSSMPDREKLKVFDKSLADLDMLLEQTKKSGPLCNLCTKAIAENASTLKQLEVQKDSQTRSALAGTIASLQAKKDLVAAVHAELLAKKKNALKAQLAFLKAEHTGNSEAAKAAMDTTIATVSDLNEVIDRLGKGLAADNRAR
jgi:hypothetical protein